MRVSCSGCRVLRKACSEDCSIRPCLRWIKNSESQANATVFLAKFYGRAGLINLIDAGPEHLRPAIFRSLLYEACGRMVNPIYGSAGLLCSGSWQLCQAAVMAVLKGAPIMQIPSGTAATAPVDPQLHKASSFDIRHVSKEDAGVAAAATHDPHKMNRATRTSVKRSGDHCCNSAGGAGVEPARVKRQCYAVDFHDTSSRESSGSQASEPSSTGCAAAVPCDGDSWENEATLSLETVEASVMTSHGGAEAGKADYRVADDGEVELELTLGFKPLHHNHSPHSSSSGGHSGAHIPTWSSSRSAAAKPPNKCDGNGMDGLGGGTLTTDLRQDLPA